MALTDYITEAELKATLTMNGTSFADGDIPVAISAASQGIDLACGRRSGFGLDTQDVTRYYSPFSHRTVEIDDLAAVTSVKIDRGGDGSFAETWTENTEFVFEPLNAIADGWARELIRVHPRANRRLPIWPRSIQVVGRFGWPAVPDGVIQATTILASRLIKRSREAPFGILMMGMDTAAVARIARTDPDVSFLIGPYMKEPVAA